MNKIRQDPAKLAQINARRDTDEFRAKKREWNRANIVRIRALRNARLLRAKLAKHGVPPDTKVPDRCDLCGRPDTDRRLAVDHDPATNRFRGFLCKRCNLSLGHLGDNVEGLERALAYVRRSAC